MPCSLIGGYHCFKQIASIFKVEVLCSSLIHETLQRHNLEDHGPQIM
jgi:hypothetical protein